MFRVIINVEHLGAAYEANPIPFVQERFPDGHSPKHSFKSSDTLDILKSSDTLDILMSSDTLDILKSSDTLDTLKSSDTLDILKSSKMRVHLG